MIFLTQQQIQDCTNWLIKKGTPAVQFLTYKNLIPKIQPRPHLNMLWEKVKKSDEVQKIFSKQNKDGSWYSGNPWAAKPSYSPSGGYTPYAPKFSTAIWVLSVLGDMGFTANDAEIKKASEYVFHFQDKNGFFSRFRDKSLETDQLACVNMPCDMGIYLQALGKIGLGKDKRLDKSYDLLVQRLFIIS